jgi:hypothetical protein
MALKNLKLTGFQKCITTFDIFHCDSSFYYNAAVVVVVCRCLSLLLFFKGKLRTVNHQSQQQ